VESTHVPVSTPSFRRPPDDSCPTCGQAISHLVFEEIQAKLAAAERDRATRSQRLVTQEVAKARAAAEALAKAKIAETEKAAEEREKKARLEAQQQAEAALAPKLAAAEAAKKELAEAKKTAASREAAVRAETKSQVEATLAPKIAAAAAAQRELVETKAAYTKELSAQRSALEKERDKALGAEKARAFKANQRMSEKVASLQRQLDHKTADELGEGAEVDVFESLKAEFPMDKIQRVKKGEAGADIIHEILNNGRICGKIVYDSKNREAWRNDYTTKLRDDQIAAEADHAILSSRVFPAGTKQLHVKDGVIVANPARVIALVHILREHVLQVSDLTITVEARDEKSTQLYEFITSDRCNQQFEQMESVAEALLALDVKEVTAHQKTWSDRGQLVRKLERARTTLQFDINQITGTAAEERSA
jgi:hypothetical protein